MKKRIISVVLIVSLVGGMLLQGNMVSIKAAPKESINILEVVPDYKYQELSYLSGSTAPFRVDDIYFDDEGLANLRHVIPNIEISGTRKTTLSRQLRFPWWNLGGYLAIDKNIGYLMQVALGNWDYLTQFYRPNTDNVYDKTVAENNDLEDTNDVVLTTIDKIDFSSANRYSVAANSDAYIENSNGTYIYVLDRYYSLLEDCVVKKDDTAITNFATLNDSDVVVVSIGEQDVYNGVWSDLTRYLPNTNFEENLLGNYIRYEDSYIDLNTINVNGYSLTQYDENVFSDTDLMVYIKQDDNKLYFGKWSDLYVDTIKLEKTLADGDKSFEELVSYLELFYPTTVIAVYDGVNKIAEGTIDSLKDDYGKPFVGTPVTYTVPTSTPDTTPFASATPSPTDEDDEDEEDGESSVSSSPTIGTTSEPTITPSSSPSDDKDEKDEEDDSKVEPTSLGGGSSNAVYDSSDRLLVDIVFNVNGVEKSIADLVLKYETDEDLVSVKIEDNYYPVNTINIYTLNNMNDNVIVYKDNVIYYIGAYSDLVTYSSIDELSYLQDNNGEYVKINDDYYLLSNLYIKITREMKFVRPEMPGGIVYPMNDKGVVGYRDLNDENDTGFVPLPVWPREEDLPIYNSTGIVEYDTNTYNVGLDQYIVDKNYFNFIYNIYTESTFKDSNLTKDDSFIEWKFVNVYDGKSYTYNEDRQEWEFVDYIVNNHMDDYIAANADFTYVDKDTILKFFEYEYENMNIDEDTYDIKYKELLRPLDGSDNFNWINNDAVINYSCVKYSDLTSDYIESFNPDLIYFNSSANKELALYYEWYVDDIDLDMTIDYDDNDVLVDSLENTYKYEIQNGVAKTIFNRIKSADTTVLYDGVLKNQITNDKLSNFAILMYLTTAMYPNIVENDKLVWLNFVDIFDSGFKKGDIADKMLSVTGAKIDELKNFSIDNINTQAPFFEHKVGILNGTNRVLYHFLLNEIDKTDYTKEVFDQKVATDGVDSETMSYRTAIRLLLDGRNESKIQSSTYKILEIQPCASYQGGVTFLSEDTTKNEDYWRLKMLGIDPYFNGDVDVTRIQSRTLEGIDGNLCNDYDIVFIGANYDLLAHLRGGNSHTWPSLERDASISWSDIGYNGNNPKLIQVMCSDGITRGGYDANDGRYQSLSNITLNVYSDAEGNCYYDDLINPGKKLIQITDHTISSDGKLDQSCVISWDSGEYINGIKRTGYAGLSFNGSSMYVSTRDGFGVYTGFPVFLDGTCYYLHATQPLMYETQTDHTKYQGYAGIFSMGDKGNTVTVDLNKFAVYFDVFGSIKNVNFSILESNPYIAGITTDTSVPSFTLKTTPDSVSKLETANLVLRIEGDYEPYLCKDYMGHFATYTNSELSKQELLCVFGDIETKKNYEYILADKPDSILTYGYDNMTYTMGTYLGKVNTADYYMGDFAGTVKKADYVLGTYVDSVQTYNYLLADDIREARYYIYELGIYTKPTVEYYLGKFQGNKFIEESHVTGELPDGWHKGDGIWTENFGWKETVRDENNNAVGYYVRDVEQEKFIANTSRDWDNLIELPSDVTIGTEYKNIGSGGYLIYDSNNIVIGICETTYNNPKKTELTWNKSSVQVYNNAPLDFEYHLEYINDYNVIIDEYGNKVGIYYGPASTGSGLIDKQPTTYDAELDVSWTIETINNIEYIKDSNGTIIGQIIRWLDEEYVFNNKTPLYTNKVLDKDYILERNGSGYLIKKDGNIVGYATKVYNSKHLFDESTVVTYTNEFLDGSYTFDVIDGTNFIKDLNGDIVGTLISGTKVTTLVTKNCSSYISENLPNDVVKVDDKLYKDNVLYGIVKSTNDSNRMYIKEGTERYEIITEDDFDNLYDSFNVKWMNIYFGDTTKPYYSSISDNKLYIYNKGSKEPIGFVYRSRYTVDFKFKVFITPSGGVQQKISTVFNDSVMNGTLYNHIGDRILLGSGSDKQAYNYQGITYRPNEFSVARLSGNDISKKNYEQLAAFVQMGKLVIVAKEIYNDDGVTLDESVLDGSAYMTKFLKTYKDRLYHENKLSNYNFNTLINTDYRIDVEGLNVPVYRDYTKGIWSDSGVTFSEEDYGNDGGKLEYSLAELGIESESDKDIAFYTDNRNIKITFKAKQLSDYNYPDGYNISLYLDTISDGVFSDTEKVDNIRITDGNGNPVGVSGLRSNGTYTVQFDVDDKISGVVHWQLRLSKNGIGSTENIVPYKSADGYFAVREAKEPEIMKVLQILPKEKESTLYLDTDEKLKSYIDGVKDYKFVFFSVKEDDMIKEENGSYVLKDYIIPDTKCVETYEKYGLEYRDINGLKLQDFDVIVLGFGDEAIIATEECVLNGLIEFTQSGKSVITSHDNTNFSNKKTDTVSNTAFNKYFRTVVGQDRFGVNARNLDEEIEFNKLGTPEDNNYFFNNNLHLSDAGYASFTNLVKQEGFDYNEDRNGPTLEGIEGITDGYVLSLSDDKLNGGQYLLFDFFNVYKFSSADKSNSSAWNSADGPDTSRLVCSNRGQVSNYPYYIDDEITIAPTHPQFYQVNLDDDDLTVWYTIEGKDDIDLSSASALYNSYLAADTKDARNNYYIYTNGNVIYTGIGHTNKITDDEYKLFVNTLVMAFKQPVTVPELQLTNENAVKMGDVSYLYLDADTYDLTDILDTNMINDTTLRLHFKITDQSIAINKKNYVQLQIKNKDNKYISLDSNMYSYTSNTPLSVIDYSLAKKLVNISDNKDTNNIYDLGSNDTFYVDINVQDLVNIYNDESIGNVIDSEAKFRLDFKGYVYSTYGATGQQKAYDTHDIIIIKRDLFDIQ